MNGWTLGQISARSMALEAYCSNRECRRFYIFDLKRLIETAGADFAIADIPPQTCEKCGAGLDIRISMSTPERDA